MKFNLLFEASKIIGKELFKELIKSAKNDNKVIKVSENNIESSLSRHFTKVNSFTKEISFKELNKPRSLFSIYIPLDLLLNLRDRQLNDNATEPTGIKAASEVIEDIFTTSTNNIVIIGVPGAGKTTTLKYICQKLLTDENYLSQEIKYPLLVRFRESEILDNEAIPLFEYILNIYGIIVDNGPSNLTEEEKRKSLNYFKKNFVLKLLDSQYPLLLLDGIDEISDERVKSSVISNINDIALGAPNARFILTTRKGDDTFHINNSRQFELSELNDAQIFQFSKKWLGDITVNNFLTQLKESTVYDSGRRPLTLSHLCAIFEKEGKIPEKSKSIYKKVVNMLISEWNSENDIHNHSKFTNFAPDRKKDFLENIAFELSTNFRKYQFTTSDLQKCYLNICYKFDLLHHQMQNVIQEIQIQNGILIQTGYDKFEFSHKSFQEYLAAEYLVKLPKIPKFIQFSNNPYELAIAVSLSSEPSDYLEYLIDELFFLPDFNLRFLKGFFTRIELEKPDFNDSYLLGKSLLKLYNFQLKQIFKTCPIQLPIKGLYDSSYKKFRSLVLELDECFKYLFYNNNIKSSVKEYFNQYIYSAINIVLADIEFTKGFQAEEPIQGNNYKAESLESEIFISKTLEKYMAD